MTDPWEIDAQQLNAERTAAERLEQARRDEEAARFAAQQRAAAEAARTMRAAIEYAVPRLLAFMTQRGAAAQRLLAESGERAHVLFGSNEGGGSYHSVYLDGNGLRQEIGRFGGYGGTPENKSAATVHDAVGYFAHYGAGKGKPEQVRNIVAWLTERIDAYRPH